MFQRLRVWFKGADLIDVIYITSIAIFLLCALVSTGNATCEIRFNSQPTTSPAN